MALSRREVFIAKVLKKLFPAVPSTSSHSRVPSEEQKTALRNPASDTGQRDSKSIQSSSEHANTPGDDNEILPPRKLYTVSLPPEGYIQVSPNTINDPDSESSKSNEDTAEEDYQGQPKRKRTRSKKQKNTLQNPGNLYGEQTELKKHGTLFQDNLQLQQTDSPRISKNKKRKMKKKRQKEKMRAGGLLTKTTCVDFTYQPDKSNSDGGVDFEDIDEKADGILDFLQATREIYFTDTKSKHTDSDVSPATIEEILQHLESRSMASSDVMLLHQMKSLVLLQDIERLKGALEQIQEHSVMPPEHARIISSLFHYWITDILPAKNQK
ncbi:PREDICTED: glutamate-rich protein 1 isoform X1 [Gavialis gangeticus]|uniref:glutamate-rich protein 1 isoform X1 n=1 Tax=Gavialis gangeticus TaxID=94835 RepID=UPI00092FA0FC|nr:PREDICTED: glutamate-rich protein 1 isoform X1 [Gavialis gangeticus]